MVIIFSLFLVTVVGSAGYHFVYSPKKWMREYGDGVYSPLRKAYKKAAQ